MRHQHHDIRMQINDRPHEKVEREEVEQVRGDHAALERTEFLLQAPLHTLWVLGSFDTEDG